MNSHTLAWAGIDPERVEAAHVVVDGDRLTARGTSVLADWALDWRLTTGPGFVTRALSVRLRGDGGARSLELTRSEADGAWTARRREGEPGEGREERLDTTGLDGRALDCDLALCPVTNTMPILRHGLAAGTSGAGRTAASGSATDLVMAWVSVPDLGLHASPQAYTAQGDGRVGFASEGFEATLVVDADGFVVDYPGIASRLG